MKKILVIQQQFEFYETHKDLSKLDLSLVKAAVKIAKKAHAPYSNFKVGAAVLLENGEIITGNNQENAAYPAGLCAERVALFYAAAQFPTQKIKSLAIVANYKKSKLQQPVSPCGSCRQAIAEYESKFKAPIRIIMSCENGKSIACGSVSELLPLMFDRKKLF